jgi:hypothetical protein
MLELLHRRKVIKEIACPFWISYNTLRVHLKHHYKKLQVRSRSQPAVKFTIDGGGAESRATARSHRMPGSAGWLRTTRPDYRGSMQPNL